MLEGIDYVPLLHTKRAEVRALGQLDKSSRDRMLPILVARPGDHHDMDKTWSLYAAAVGPYRYGLDLDRYKFGVTSAEPAKSQFDMLFDPANGFQNYYDRIRHLDGAIPVFRSNGGEFSNLGEQFDQIDSVDRGVFVRIERNFSQNWKAIIEHERFHPHDTVIVVDLGWALDVLQLESWASNIIREVVEIRPDTEIVAISSCFPTSFSHIEKKGVFSIDDRELYNRLVAQHNSANLTFGDWGSTRSAQDQGGGKPWPRIDIASTGDWTCFRKFGAESGYCDVANRLKGDGIWSSVPTSWGKNAIHCTALNIPGKITGTEIATSVRVNIHLTVQALGGAEPLPDEIPYEDNF